MAIPLIFLAFGCSKDECSKDEIELSLWCAGLVWSHTELCYLCTRWYKTRFIVMIGHLMTCLYNVDHVINM